jgi:hypothetical protein
MKLLTRPAILFAAAASGGALIGRGELASAQCACLPQGSIWNIPGIVLKYLGSQTYGWDGPLPSGTRARLNVDSGPYGYVDFKTASWSTGTRTVWATVCRVSWTGTAVNCSGGSGNQYTVSANTDYSNYVDFTGAVSSSYDVWDFWKVNLKGSEATGLFAGDPLGVHIAASWA